MKFTILLISLFGVVAVANENLCGTSYEQGAKAQVWMEQNIPSFNHAQNITNNMVMKSIYDYNDFLIQITGLLPNKGYISYTFGCDSESKKLFKLTSVVKSQNYENVDHRPEAVSP